MASAIRSYIALCAVELTLCREAAPTSRQVDLPTLLVESRRGGCQGKTPAPRGHTPGDTQ